MTERTRKVIERHREVIEMYEAGKMKVEIAQATGYSQETIRKILRGNGITAEMEQIDVKSLVYAMPRKPEPCIVDGKLYTDLTPLFG